MFRIKFKGPSKGFRNYSPSSLVSAYNMVKTESVSVYKAAKLHGVPLTTLGDRIDNRISVDTTKSGPAPVLSLDEEERLCKHIKKLAELGYGYTRAEVIDLASDYAVSLGKRTPDKPFSLQWFYDFMRRWPELKLVKPSSLSEQRAKCSSEKCIRNYFDELARIMSKYDLVKKPHNIYNIDEKGINTEYRAPNVVAGITCKPQAIMAERSKTITIIGAGNALGMQIPPFFVFPGERMLVDLLEGKSPGADGMMTKSGWSNADVFRHYMKNHFLKYVQGRDENETVLVLYDGHRSHISLDLIQWALAHNIILFVLPPHTSHILQPMDVGCFGPLQTIYNQQCTTFARLNHRVVTRYDVCALACKAYITALSPSNLQAAFRRSGIYPLLDGSVMCDQLGLKLKPSTLYDENVNASEDCDCVGNVPDNSEKENDNNVSIINGSILFDSKTLKVKERQTEKRRNVSDAIGGRALEGDTIVNLKNYMQNTKPAKRAKTDITVKGKKEIKSECNVSVPLNHITCSPQPGPSHFNLVDSTSESEPDSEEERDTCCICKSYYVPRDKLDESLFIVKWVGCDKCSHWVHLKYCTSLRVARKDTPLHVIVVSE